MSIDNSKNTENNKALIVAENITKIYTRGTEKIHAVDGISLTVNPGDYTAFVGPSGSGKTTLLHILGCLDNPTSGKIILNGETIFANDNGPKEKELTLVRRQYFGYIFQKFYLIPTLTVLENILVPVRFTGNKIAAAQALPILEKVGLSKRLNHLPGELSGGEMQRVAIARALIQNPKILLADEPTGNLDTARSDEIAGILKQLNQEGLTIIMVTHNLELAAQAKKIVTLRDGKIVS
jgi:putative ABC transport system ATP-binding protein